jgi:NTP pyrophosphatase (non-canonical NTP hydrolase)
MDIKTYVEQASRTNPTLDKHYSEVDSIHMILGMTTEVGELVDVYKKHLAYKKPLDMVNVKEELGDLMWYIANFCNINNIDLEQALQTNIDKLRARYSEKFTEHEALHRDLNTERDILEKL